MFLSFKILLTFRQYPIETLDHLKISVHFGWSNWHKGQVQTWTKLNYIHLPKLKTSTYFSFLIYYICWISGARQWKWMLIDLKWPAYCADSTAFLVTCELFVNANIIQILIDRKQKYFKSHFHYKAHKLWVLIQQTLMTCMHTSLIDVLFSNEFDCVNYCDQLEFKLHWEPEYGNWNSFLIN